MLKIIKSWMTPRGAKMTAKELADKFGLKIQGDPNTVINGIAPIADARPGQVAF